jgi:DNA-directed RNA polymerase specialized sigma24 family protein
VNPEKFWNPNGDKPPQALAILSKSVHRLALDQIKKARRTDAMAPKDLEEIADNHENQSSCEDQTERPSVEAIEKIFKIAGLDKQSLQSLLAAIKDPNNWKVGEAEDAESKLDYKRLAANQGTSVNTVQQQVKRIREAVYKRFGGSAGFMLALRSLAWIRQNLPRLLAWLFIIIALLLSVVLIHTSATKNSLKTFVAGNFGNKAPSQTIAPAVNGGLPTTENNLADQSTVPKILAAVPTANYTLVNTNLTKLKFRVLLDNIAHDSRVPMPTVEFSLDVDDNQQLRDLLKWFDGNEIVRIWYGDNIRLSIPVHDGDYKLEVASVKTLTRSPRGSGENFRMLPDSITNFDYVARIYPTRDNAPYDVPYSYTMNVTNIPNMAKIALYAIEHVIPGKLDRYDLILTNDFLSVYYDDLDGLSTNFIVPAEH